MKGRDRSYFYILSAVNIRIHVYLNGIGPLCEKQTWRSIHTRDLTHQFYLFRVIEHIEKHVKDYVRSVP